MIAFAWPEIGHLIINVVSQVPRHEGYSKPSNPRAAALQGWVAAGSLSVTPVQRQPRRSDTNRPHQCVDHSHNSHRFDACSLSLLCRAVEPLE